MSDAYDREPTDDEIDAVLHRIRVPAILLIKTTTPDEPGAPGCRFGGKPTLPPEFEWPWFRSNENGDPNLAVPMQFLMQIDLRHVPRLIEFPDMPRTGTLFFFFDLIVAPGVGFGDDHDPCVFYYEGDVTGFPEREQPDYTLPKDWEERRLPKQVKRWNMSFGLINTYDSIGFQVENTWNREKNSFTEFNLKIVGEISDELVANREAICNSVASEAMHHLLGRYRISCDHEMVSVLSLFWFDGNEWSLDYDFDCKFSYYLKNEDFKERKFENTWMGEN